MVNSRQIRFNLAKTPLRAPLIWYRHRYLHENDVVIASYPRSGSTWLRFLLFNLISDREADFSTVQAEIPGIENESQASPLLPKGGRLLQTHELCRPEYHRAIYLIRDVRDVVISEFYFLLRKGFVDDDFNSFIKHFFSGKVNPFGYWGNHVESWIDSEAARKHKVFILKYEEMRADPETALVNISAFLGIERSSTAIRAAIESNTVERMQKKESKAPEGTFNIQRSDIRFIRQGSSGGWQNILTEDQLDYIHARAGSLLSRLGYIQHDPMPDQHIQNLAKV